MTSGVDLPPPEELPATQRFELQIKGQAEPVVVEAVACEIEHDDYVFYDTERNVVATVAAATVTSMSSQALE